MKILELSRASRVGEEERLSVCRSSTFRPSSNYAYFTVYLIIAPYIFRQYLMALFGHLISRSSRVLFRFVHAWPFLETNAVITEYMFIVRQRQGEIRGTEIYRTQQGSFPSMLLTSNQTDSSQDIADDTLLLL